MEYYILIKNYMLGLYLMTKKDIHDILLDKKSQFYGNVSILSSFCKTKTKIKTPSKYFLYICIFLVSMWKTT